MISEKSKRLYKAVITVCYHLNTIPYKLVTTSSSSIVLLQISPRIKWYKWTVYWNSLVGVILLFYLFKSVLMSQHFEPFFLLLCVATFILELLVMGVQAFLYFGYDALLKTLNTGQVTQGNLGKFSISELQGVTYYNVHFCASYAWVTLRFVYLSFGISYLYHEYNG